ncbi:hypothetical protein L596_015733 [Steinernema carpocapsae]|uniref:Uncharacterized protein n=1 Tax=Steinernema carpocapsae TaxID=34508 RepID=A0A4U5NGU7_STECR|nr:hypothetical protein L596_015733 [Steinernema carpocapsae]
MSIIVIFRDRSSFILSAKASNKSISLSCFSRTSFYRDVLAGGQFCGRYRNGYFEFVGQYTWKVGCL